jgi:hypothetical protein
MRIAPEGDFALAYGYSIPAWQSIVAGLRRNANATTWQLEGIANFLPANPLLMSSMTRLVAGQRQILVVDGTGTTMQAYSGDGETWTPGPMFPLDATGLLAPNSPPGLTADGLHLVIGGADTTGHHGTFYFERTGIDLPFGPALYVDTIPLATYDAFMTNDCGTVYFDAIETLLYVEQ